MIWIKYTYYKECFLANVIECSALLLVVLGAAIGIFNVEKTGYVLAVLIFAVSFIAHFGVKYIASKVNTRQIERKVSEDAAYAKYVAETYPEMTLRCIELNREYADHGDKIPYVDFHPKRQRNSMMIQIVGLGVLLLLLAGIIGMCVYVQNLGF